MFRNHNATTKKNGLRAKNTTRLYEHWGVIFAVLYSKCSSKKKTMQLENNFIFFLKIPAGCSGLKDSYRGIRQYAIRPCSTCFLRPPGECDRTAAGACPRAIAPTGAQAFAEPAALPLWRLRHLHRRSSMGADFSGEVRRSNVLRRNSGQTSIPTHVALRCYEGLDSPATQSMVARTPITT